MESLYAAPDLAIIDTADRIGRAAYLWLRQRTVSSGTFRSPIAPLSGPLNDGRREQLLAAGFISKLCDTLQLTTQHGVIAAYAYSLLDGSDSNSLEIAAILFNARSAPITSTEFEEGRTMAGDMLGLLEASGHTAVPDDDFTWPATYFAC